MVDVSLSCHLERGQITLLSKQSTRSAIAHGMGGAIRPGHDGRGDGCLVRGLGGISRREGKQRRAREPSKTAGVFARPDLAGRGVGDGPQAIAQQPTPSHNCASQ
jgi:hypothetical protein